MPTEKPPNQSSRLLTNSLSVDHASPQISEAVAEKPLRIASISTEPARVRLGPRTVSVSVDLDAPEDYFGFYRRPGPPPADPFLGQALDFLHDAFGELGIRATFFAIGRDALGPEARRCFLRLAAAGHEIANHSQTHPPAFRSLPSRQRQAEIDSAAARLADAAGSPVVGFRCPAYDLDRELLGLLLDRGYRYDSSLLPTPFLLPMKWLVQWKARRRKVGLGRLAHGIACRAPHFCWRHRGRVRTGRRPGAAPNLVELPLSVVPPLRLPFYGTITQTLGLRAFDLGLATLRRGCLPINYSLHAAEVAPLPGSDGLGRAAVVPGYGTSLDGRRRLVIASLSRLMAGAEAIPLCELAERVTREAGAR